MPKTKTHKGLKKSVRVTKSGKVLRGKAGKSHLLTSKSSKRRRKLRKSGTITGKQAKTIKSIL